MHRMKIGLVAAIVLLALTAGVYVVVTRELKESIVQQVDTDVSRAQRIHGDVARLEATEFENQVDGLLATARRSWACSTSPTRTAAARRRSSSARRSTPACAPAASRKADIVAILDSSGKVLARDLNVNAMFGEDLRSKFPAVGTALSGKATKDIWTLQDRMNRVAIAPIIAARRDASAARCWSATC